MYWTGSTRFPTSDTDTQKVPVPVAVPDICAPVEATAVMSWRTRHKPVDVLGVPTPTLTAALGSMLVRLTLIPPTCCTVN